MPSSSSAKRKRAAVRTEMEMAEDGMEMEMERERDHRDEKVNHNSRFSNDNQKHPILALRPLQPR
jgi:hypothetical protein